MQYEIGTWEAGGYTALMCLMSLTESRIRWQILLCMHFATSLQVDKGRNDKQLGKQARLHPACFRMLTQNKKDGEQGKRPRRRRQGQEHVLER